MCRTRKRRKIKIRRRKRTKRTKQVRRYKGGDWCKVSDASYDAIFDKNFHPKVGDVWSVN